jgi:Pantoate-beta-alanine ligase
MASQILGSIDRPGTHHGCTSWLVDIQEVCTRSCKSEPVLSRWTYRTRYVASSPKHVYGSSFIRCKPATDILVQRSLAHNDITVVSIFVNPAQFAAHEDLSTYPITFDSDMARLEKVSAAQIPQKSCVVFLPSVSDMYPSGIVQDVKEQKGTFVEVKGYGHQMEGKSRPTFFRGVATVGTDQHTAPIPQVVLNILNFRVGCDQVVQCCSSERALGAFSRPCSDNPNTVFINSLPGPISAKRISNKPFCYAVLSVTC